MTLFGSFTEIFHKKDEAGADNVDGRFHDAVDNSSNDGSTTDVSKSPKVLRPSSTQSEQDARKGSMDSTDAADNTDSSVTPNQGSKGFPGATRFTRSRTTDLSRVGRFSTRSTRANTSSWDEALKDSSSSSPESRRHFTRANTSSWSGAAPCENTGADVCGDWRAASRPSLEKGEFQFSGANADFNTTGANAYQQDGQVPYHRSQSPGFHRQGTFNSSPPTPSHMVSSHSILGEPPKELSRGMTSFRRQGSTELDGTPKPMYRKQSTGLSLLGDRPGAGNGILSEAPLPNGASVSSQPPRRNFVRQESNTSILGEPPAGTQRISLSRMDSAPLTPTDCAGMFARPEGLVRASSSLSNILAENKGPMSPGALPSKLSMKKLTFSKYRDEGKPMLHRSGSRTYADSAGGLPYGHSMPRVCEQTPGFDIKPVVRRMDSRSLATSSEARTDSSAERTGSPGRSKGPLGPNGGIGFLRVRTVSPPFVFAA